VVRFADDQELLEPGRRGGERVEFRNDRVIVAQQTVHISLKTKFNEDMRSEKREKRGGDQRRERRPAVRLGRGVHTDSLSAEDAAS